jgi:subtilisin family serine protease
LPVAPPVESAAVDVPPVAGPGAVVAQPGPTAAPVVDDDGDETTDGFRAQQAIVRLTAGTDVDAFTARNRSGVAAAVPSRDLYLLRLPVTDDDAAFVRTLAADPDARWAELNYTSQAPEGRPSRFFVSGDTLPSDPGPDYAPGRLRLPAAHGCATGAGATVAVIDTGIDAGHPDLADRIGATGWNAVEGGPDIADVGNGLDDDGDGFVDEMTGHGTHVAGIVLQAAPWAKILAVKALDSDGVGQAFYLARAIYYATSQDADVINLSLGSTENPRVVREAVAAAVKAKVVVTAAAGNLDRETPPEYPATGPKAIGVAATDRDDRKSAFSNYHPDLAISAPGTDIVSAFPNNEYRTWGGTSMATPWVAAAAALLLDAHPTSTPAEVEDRLRAAAADIDDANGAYAGKLGAGRLDVAAAVACDGA